MLSSVTRHIWGNYRRWIAACICLMLIGTSVWSAQYLFTSAYGAQLGFRSMKLSSSEISATADYLLSFDLSTAGPLGSIVVQFCSNDPIPGDPCTFPGGFDDSGAALINQTGPTGFIIDPASTANQIVLSRTIAPAAPGAATYHFTGIKNPSSPGSYYVRVQTYATNDASGPASDYGGIAIAITNSVAISATVPPYLIFCTGITIASLNCANASGNYIDFGEMLTSQAGQGTSQILIATNAQSGYAVTMFGTTLTSGNNVINPLIVNDVSRPGISQFGLNLRVNTTPSQGSDPTGPGVAASLPSYSQADFYRFVSGDTIISNPVPDDIREFTASYIVNRPIGQAPGIYVSTITYICLASF